MRAAEECSLRAAGPMPAGFGVSGMLARPRLTLDRDGQNVSTATEWGAAGVKAFAFGEGSADAALPTELEPGAYSLVVTGADGGSAVALVEVYEVTAGL